MKKSNKINENLFDTKNLISRAEQNKTSGGNNSDIMYLDTGHNPGEYDVTIDSLTDTVHSPDALDKPFTGITQQDL